jgi:cytochrome c oxidase subunit 2
MAFLLALVISLITLVSMYIFAAKMWWFPPLISEQRAAYDEQFMLTLVVTGIIFFFAQLGLCYAVFRYRDRGGRAHYSHGNTKMEIIWTSATAVLFVGLVLVGQHIWAQVHLQEAPADAVQIEIMAQQFAWNFRYSGPDGQFGRVSPELMDESVGNPLGLDYDDPAATDDLVMPVIAVPVDRPVEVIMRSKDVIHSFFVREMRIKQDVVPGMETRLHFTANTVGRYEVPCTELCGLGHSQMRTYLLVMSEQDFQDWLRDNALE